MIPNRRGRYFEPFLGGGAVFFSFRPWPATLSDVNTDLINAYQQVRDNPEGIINRLRHMRIDCTIYSTIRATRPRSPLSRAVRLLYLNRTAFNGVYRVNRRGEFNVPFGCKDGTVLCDPSLIRSASSALQNRTILVADFESIIDCASKHDVVYADPPYTTRHDNNGFRRYNECLFSWSDQERLAEACRRATRRGVTVFISNAAHTEIASLYTSFDRITTCRYTRGQRTSVWQRYCLRDAVFQNQQLI